MLNQNDNQMKKETPLTADQQKELEYIYNNTYSQVLSHTKRVVRHEQDAENVAMDVFIKIQKLIKNPATRFDESKAQLATWVHTVTNSVILDFFRTNHQDKYRAVSNFVSDESDKKDSHKVYFQFVAPSSDSADQQVLDSELHSRVAKAFRTLKPKYRKVAIMFFLRELRYEEIAENLNVPMGSVKGMLNRARQILQTELDGVYKMKAVNVQSAEA